MRLKDFIARWNEGHKSIEFSLFQAPFAERPTSIEVRYPARHPDRGGSQGPSGPVTHVTAFVLSTSFCQHISVNTPRIPVGTEESHMEPDGSTKNEERGIRAAFGSCGSLCGALNTRCPWSRINDPGEASRCQRTQSGRLSGENPTTTFLPSGSE